MTVIIQLQYNVKYKLTELDFLPISLEENRLRKGCCHDQVTNMWETKQGKSFPKNVEIIQNRSIQIRLI